MLQTIRKRLNNKGFTLVELIVVLVILAILAALLIPSLTGYIDRARQESVVAETRMVVLAAQTVLSEDYGQKDTFTDGTIVYPVTDDEGEVKPDDELSEHEKLGGEISLLSETEGNFEITYSEQAKVLTVTYTHNGYKCTYDNGTYDCAAIGPEGSEDSDDGSGSNNTDAQNGKSIETNITETTW